MTSQCNLTIIKINMGRKQPFFLIFDPEVQQHWRTIEIKYHLLIRRTIEVKL